MWRAGCRDAAPSPSVAPELPRLCVVQREQRRPPRSVPGAARARAPGVGAERVLRLHRLSLLWGNFLPM